MPQLLDWVVIDGEEDEESSAIPREPTGPPSSSDLLSTTDLDASSIPSNSSPPDPPPPEPPPPAVVCFNCTHPQPYDSSTVFLQCTHCGCPLQIPSPPSPPPAPTLPPSPPSFLDELTPLLPPCIICNLPLISPPLVYLTCGHVLHDHHKFIFHGCPCASAPPYTPADLSYAPRVGEVERWRAKKDSERLHYGVEKGPVHSLYLNPLDIARMLVHGEEEEEATLSPLSMHDRIARAEAQLKEETEAVATLASEKEAMRGQVVHRQVEVGELKEAISRMKADMEECSEEKMELRQQLYDTQRGIQWMEREDEELRKEMDRGHEDKAAVLREDTQGWGAESPSPRKASLTAQRERWEHLQLQLQKHQTALQAAPPALLEDLRTAKGRLAVTEEAQQEMEEEVGRLRAAVAAEKAALESEERGEGRLKRRRVEARVDLTVKDTALTPLSVSLSLPILSKSSPSPMTTRRPSSPPKPFAAYQSSSSLLPRPTATAAVASAGRFPSFRPSTGARDGGSFLMTGPDGKGGVVSVGKLRGGSVSTVLQVSTGRGHNAKPIAAELTRSITSFLTPKR